MKKKIFHLNTMSALHVGTGQGVGVVDLPIARSKATHLPLVPGSAVKGVLRDEFATQCELNQEDINTLFGPDNVAGDSFAGALAFGDANLLILPIRSFAGTVAYATSPFVLRQYARDFGVALEIPRLEKNRAAITSSELLLLGNANAIALEDLDIDADHDVNTDHWAEFIAGNLYPEGTLNAEEWQKEFKDRFVVLPDDIFSFLVDTATEIRARIRINRETRIVQQGALWMEENLPAESVLWGVLGVNRAFDQTGRSAEELEQLLPDELMVQIGGKYSVGRGLCRLLISKERE